MAHNPDLEQLLEELPPEYRAKEHLIEYISQEGIELVL
jgi:predicted metal-dependent hydrolase